MQEIDATSGILTTPINRPRHVHSLCVASGGVVSSYHDTNIMHGAREAYHVPSVVLHFDALYILFIYIYIYLIYIYILTLEMIINLKFLL